MHRLFVLFIFWLIHLYPFTTKLEGQPRQPEIIYHICQRSFYDSNGDFQGDLKGLEQKLDYLEDLGVTSILLMPLYESVYYHNYFPIDFRKIDPEFGSESDFIDLVREIHHRKMKIYMDMETQYVTEDHLWWKDSYGNPGSEYSDYLIYNGPDNTDPESIVFNLQSLEGYDGVIKRITTINLYDPSAKNYIYDLYRYWVDPDGDGDFSDGVDGFRIDHMMDDLDWKGKITGLLGNFWKPLFDELKTINPHLQIVGEQSDWSTYGLEYFREADIDRLFAFGIKFAISSFDKKILQQKIDSTLLNTPEGKTQLIFIENHDTGRFASECESGKGKLKVGAALNLLLPGIPVIYYGQEIGMKGKGGFGAFGNTDGNDIPRREAFEWTSTLDQPGMALWYKDSGPWWDQRNVRDHDGISVEEQMEDKQSLWHFYHSMIQLRKKHQSLNIGNFSFMENNNPKVLSFSRSFDNEKLLININLSEQVQKINYEKLKPQPEWRLLFDENDLTSGQDLLSLEINSFGIQVILLPD